MHWDFIHSWNDCIAFILCIVYGVFINFSLEINRRSNQRWQMPCRNMTDISTQAVWGKVGKREVKLCPQIGCSRYLWWMHCNVLGVGTAWQIDWFSNYCGWKHVLVLLFTGLSRELDPYHVWTVISALATFLKTWIIPIYPMLQIFLG